MFLSLEKVLNKEEGWDISINIKRNIHKYLLAIKISSVFISFSQWAKIDQFRFDEYGAYFNI